MSHTALDTALAGAVLLELALLELIDNDVHHLHVVVSRGDRVPAALAPLFDALAAQRTPLGIAQGLAIVALKVPRMLPIWYDELIDLGVLKPIGRGLRSGPTAYTTADWAPVRELRRHLRALVLEDRLPDARDLALIAVLDAGGLAAPLFTQDEWVTRQPRLQQLLRMDLIGQVMLRVIRETDPASYEDTAARLLGLREHAPSSTAGGLPAVVSAMGHVYRALGVRRGALALSRMNQPGGFDCPGCAWPESGAAEARLDFCENGAKALAAEANSRTLDAGFFATWSLADLAAQSDYWLEQQGRLTQPMIRDADASHYRPASYEEAYALIARELRALSSSAQAVFYTCGHAVNEAAFLFQLCARQFGTNNLPSSINLCHEPSGKALQQALGYPKGDARLEDFERADAIFLFGHNPGSNHPRMLLMLERAARRGASIVAINPMLEAGFSAFANPQRPDGLLGRATSLHQLHLPVRINGDLALVKGLIKCVLEAEAREPGRVLDQDFMTQSCTDFAAFADAIASTTWESIEVASGIARARIEEAAGVYLAAKGVVVTWGLGITQQVNGTETIREIINLMLLRGHVGRAGSGLCPMRGHSNILGIRSMGAGERMPESFLTALEDATGLSLPHAPGWHAVESIRAMQRGEARALVSLGGNLAAAAPDRAATAAALRGCALTVMVSTKLNRSHVEAGRTAVILPCLARSEREVIDGQEHVVLVEDMMGGVRASRGPLAPAHPDLRGETRIVAELADTLFSRASPVPWHRYATQYDAVRRLVGQVVPAYRDAVDWAAGTARVALPNPLRQRDFSAAGGRARFAVTRLATPMRPTMEQFLLMTIRSHDQLNTSIHGLDDRYRGIRRERRVVLLNPEDMRRLAIGPEQAVHLSRPGQRQRESIAPFFAIPYPIPPGCAAAYFPEANALTDLDTLDASTGTPASKAVLVVVASA
jgi:molybdopterin-dependent oxidoreductase alpha subunit